MRPFKLVTPQVDRESKIPVASSEAAIKIGDRVDLTSEGSNVHFERQVTDGELLRLKRENSALRDQLKRTLQELKAYQVKYPNVLLSNQVVDEGENIPPWSSTPEIMTPLLDAYDTRIKELEQLVFQQSSELDIFRNKIEAVLVENEELRQIQLENIRHESEKHGSVENKSPQNPMMPLGSELINELYERVDILMAENALIVEQKALLGVELEGHTSDLAQRCQDLDHMAQKVSELELTSQQLRDQARQAQMDRNEAARQAVGYSDALGVAESELEVAQEQVRQWKAKNRDLEVGLSEAQKQSRDVRTQSEHQCMEAMRHLKVAEDRVRQLQVECMQKAQELESTQEVLRKLRREYQSTRQDAEGMLQVMAGLERQIAEYSAREGEVQRLGRDAKEKVEEALSARDQALAREDQFKKEMARLHDERKQAALRRQADIDAAVQLGRHRAAEQLVSCEKDLQDMAERNATLKSDSERAMREAKSCREALDRMQRLHEDERRAVETAAKELADKLCAAVVAKEEEAGRRLEIQETNKEYRQTIDKLRNQLDGLRSQVLQQDRFKETEVSGLKQSLRDNQREIAEKSRLLGKVQKELEELKEGNKEQLSAVERKLLEENSLYRRRAAEADRLAGELEQEMNAGGRRSTLLVDQIKEKSSLALRQADLQLREEAELSRSLAARSKELESTVRGLAEEKSSLLAVVEEARETIAQLQEDLTDTRGTVVELTYQLSASYSARESGARKAAIAMEAIIGEDEILRAGEFDLDVDYDHEIGDFAGSGRLPASYDNDAGEDPRHNQDIADDIAEYKSEGSGDRFINGIGDDDDVDFEGDNTF